MPPTFRLRSIGTALLIALPLGAQPPRPAQEKLREVSVTPISTLHPDWLNEGVASPNGRFIVFRSFAGSTFARYDRNTRQWATLKDVELGWSPRWSPDGRFLAYSLGGTNRSVWLLPMDTATGMPRGNARRITTSNASWAAWSPDGRRIAYSVQDSGRFRIAHVPFNGGDETVLYESRGNGGDLAWSHDGKYLWAGHHPPINRPLYWLRVDVATRKVDSFPMGPARTLGYSPDGRNIAHYDQALSLLTITSTSDGRILQRLALSPQIRPTGWSPTTPGALVAVEHVVPSHIQRVSLEDGRIESITRVDSAVLSHIRISPDGRRMVYTKLVGSARQLHVANIDGSSPRALGKAGAFGQVRWSPAGTHVAYGLANLRASGGRDFEVRVVDVGSGVDRQLVRATGDGFISWQALAWRNDGQAVQYLLLPRGQGTLPREVREMTLQGSDRLLAGITTPDGSPYFINDTLLVVRKGTGLDAISLRSGATTTLYSGNIRPGGEPGVSRDGSWLVVSANNGDGMYPLLVSLSGQTRRVPYSLKGEMGLVMFHPDGRTLVADARLTCVGPNFVEKWEIVAIPMNGDAPRVLTASQPSYRDHGWEQVTPDGRHVVFVAEESYNSRAVTLTLPKP